MSRSNSDDPASRTVKPRSLGEAVEELQLVSPPAEVGLRIGSSSGGRVRPRFLLGQRFQPVDEPFRAWIGECPIPVDSGGLPEPGVLGEGLLYPSRHSLGEQNVSERSLVLGVQPEHGHGGISGLFPRLRLGETRISGGRGPSEGSTDPRP